MADNMPQIPEETVSNWQRMVDLIARLAEVPASLIMRTNAPQHGVFLRNDAQDNPYEVGMQFTLNEKLYCQGVLKEGALLVEDAACDPRWQNNDDMEHGMRFYAGFPLYWPDGSVFGTICVLDRQRNPKALMFLEGLKEFARLIEADLKLLVEADVRCRLERQLQETLDHLEAKVRERTAELEDANTALRVLLQSVEQVRDDYDEKILRQIKGLVLPILGKLRASVRMDVAATAYLDILDDNLKSISVSLSDQLTTVFEDLTPSEQDIALMIMRGQTTKDIARTLSRERSTIEYHRNNIRKKLGLRKSGQNLRSKLLSLQ